MNQCQQNSFNPCPHETNHLGEEKVNKIITDYGNLYEIKEAELEVNWECGDVIDTVDREAIFEKGI